MQHAPVRQRERDDPCARARRPRAEPGKPPAEPFRLERHRHPLGQREQRRLAIGLEREPPAARGLEEHRRVELAPVLAVVGAEDERHPRPRDERLDLPVEGRAGLALRCAEGRRIDRLGPDQEVELVPPEERGREREVRVQDRPHCLEAAEVGAKPVVLADVGLDDARGEGAAAIGV